MPRDVLRRVRWANLTLTLAVLGALAATILWPLVAAPAPALPPDVARPLMSGGGPPAATGGPVAMAAAKPAHRARGGVSVPRVGRRPPGTPRKSARRKS